MRVPCPSTAFLRASAIQIDSSLTPFLYQTATIQQWIAPHAPMRPRRGRRHASSQRSHIPFEDSPDAERKSIIEGLDGTTRSTISGTEKKAFAKLLDPSFDPKESLKQRAKSPASVGKARSRDRAGANPDPPRINDPDLDAKHQQLLAARRHAAAAQHQVASELQASQGLPFVEETEAMRHQRQQMLSTARLQFSRAKTDSELWLLLDKWAFDVFRKYIGQKSVPADASAQANDAENKKMAALTPSQKEALRRQQANFLAHNYPLLLVAFLDELRDNFPASQYAFSVLPTVKSLGRQSYVLGASTALYNGVMLDTWRVFSDFHRVNALLVEMENAGLEFDYDTVDVLSKIKRQGDRILKGERGELLKRVWQLDSILSGWTGVVGWIPKVTDSLEREALRRANERHEEELEEGRSDDEDWDEELAAMEKQEEDLRKAAASLD